MTIRALLWGLFSLALQGCASTPEPVPIPPTIVKLQIESEPIINPDDEGKAAPVMLRIYELRETSAFSSADFFALFDKEQATLASDLARKQEFPVKPGDNKTLTLQLDDNVRALGFFAAFRKLDTAKWRDIVPVVAHQTRSYLVRLESYQLAVQPIESVP